MTNKQPRQLTENDPLNSPRIRALQEEVIEEVGRALRGTSNELLENEEAITQLWSQLAAIVADVIATVNNTNSTDVDQLLHSGVTRATSRLIGQSRAAHSVHPSESLAAANTLFDVALPIMIKALSGASVSSDRAVAIAMALNRSIMKRMVPASIGYVDTLLERLSLAETEERLRLSRELHDRIAHDLAAAIQRIELGTNAVGSDDVRDNELANAVAILRSTLQETRSIAADLRHIVGDKLLDQAVADYLDDWEMSGGRGAVVSIGTPSVLPTGISEELFALIREALRNAASHASASAITVELRWEHASVTISISDDGDGFDLGSVSPRSMGLLVMRERADVIGGTISIDSTLGVGTRITVALATNEEGGNGNT